MFRYSRWIIIRAGALLLGILLVAAYLYKDSIGDKINPLQEYVEKVSIQPKPFTKESFECQQNLSVAKITGFDSFSPEIKNMLYYGHCRNFPVLLDLPDKCGGAEESADIFLLLVIKTSPPNYDRREVLRKTWAEERLYNGVWIRRIFIAGTAGDSFEEERWNALLKAEHETYNDILQWDIKDSFVNLTLKQTLFLKWMERKCLHVHFLLNGDDDVFANTDNMVDYLQSLDNDGSKHLFTGFLMGGGPIRDSRSKYFVPVEMYPSNSYPLYCSGGGYLLSVYTALVIHKMSQTIDLIPIDDVYMGMCLTKANLKPTRHMGVMTLGWKIPSSNLDQYDPCFFRNVLLVHRFFSANMYVLWKRIHDPNLKCGISK
ncbi:N-acetyllactosaminide beta-1,3-N-acetylglucosaminyltransferase 3-like [Seriola aureovittata]|uniref:N-acetyllactosaminide beta-1,3-N-acetylglucosaminyltransferase 3-like n=1 Tax=Seriola aureovittata TaxID=2871759 RepID=UPI0024BE83FD|nr:N-acetyllactosaminide beta-1,3-N-acetylglucosaminyltransferase 3-like [Seriola aureovittata]